MTNEALTSFLNGKEVTLAPIPPPVTCEACGKVVSRHDLAINCIIGIGVTGHPDIPSFQDPHEEHWACSVDCWMRVAKMSIDHVAELLLYLHTQVIPNLRSIE